MNIFIVDMYQQLAEEGTGGCLCMFFSPHQSQVQGNKNGKKKKKSFLRISGKKLAGDIFKRV